jgi:hypothetical protein
MRSLLRLALVFQLCTVARGKTQSQRARDSTGNQSAFGDGGTFIIGLLASGFFLVVSGLVAIGLLKDYCRSSSSHSGNVIPLQKDPEKAAAKQKTLETVGESPSESAGLPGVVSAAPDGATLRKTKMAAADTTGDGMIDTVGYDTTGDGRIDRVEHDTTGDGKADTVEVDYDGDGQTDATYRIN